jgi:hypothetical protein
VPHEDIRQSKLKVLNSQVGEGAVILDPVDAHLAITLTDEEPGIHQPQRRDWIEGAPGEGRTPCDRDRPE